MALTQYSKQSTPSTGWLLLQWLGYRVSNYVFCLCLSSGVLPRLACPFRSWWIGDTVVSLQRVATRPSNFAALIGALRQTIHEPSPLHRYRLSFVSKWAIRQRLPQRHVYWGTTFPEKWLRSIDGELSVQNFQVVGLHNSSSPRVMKILQRILSQPKKSECQSCRNCTLHDCWNNAFVKGKTSFFSEDCHNTIGSVAIIIVPIRQSLSLHSSFDRIQRIYHNLAECTTNTSCIRAANHMIVSGQVFVNGEAQTHVWNNLDNGRSDSSIESCKSPLLIQFRSKVSQTDWGCYCVSYTRWWFLKARFHETWKWHVRCCCLARRHGC